MDLHTNCGIEVGRILSPCYAFYWQLFKLDV